MCEQELYIQNLNLEDRFINEVTYRLDKTKKCSVGFSWARDFTPTIRISNNYERITFSIYEWSEFTINVMDKLYKYLTCKNASILKIDMDSKHSFESLKMNGNRYIQAFYYGQSFTFNKSIIGKLITTAPVVTKHLQVLEMREFPRFYNEIIASAVQMKWEDAVSGVRTLCNNITTDNSVCVEEALIVAKEKVFSDIVTLRVITSCQQVPTSLKPLGKSFSNSIEKDCATSLEKSLDLYL